MLNVCTMQDLDYKDNLVLGIAPTWPQTAAAMPSSDDWFDWEGDRPLRIPLQELVIYELHVRGFTQHASADADAPGKLCLNPVPLQSRLPLQANSFAYRGSLLDLLMESVPSPPFLTLQDLPERLARM